MGLSRSIPEQSASERAISFCQIDFNRLCDNNDYAMLTANYNRQATRNLTQTISDEKLRNYVLQAIIYDTKSKKIADDFEHYVESLELMQMQDKLQMECREYYNKTYLNTQYSETSSSANILKESGKGLTARQRCLLSYYISLDNGVQYEDGNHTCTQKAVKEALVAIFGGSLSSYNNLVKPDFNNKQTISDLRHLYVVTKIVYPRIAEKIMSEIENHEKEL